MSWFTTFFQPAKGQTNQVTEYIKEVFTGLEVKEEQLVSSKRPAINRQRFLDLTNKLLSFKDEYTKEHAFQLEQQINNVLEKISLFEGSFKLFNFDDQQLLYNEKKVFHFLQKYAVNVITLILKTNIEKSRLSFQHQGKSVKNKFQQIQEFQKMLQVQQEKADVETSIKTQQEMEDLFEQCVLLNAQRRYAAQELLKELKTVETRDKEQGETLRLQQKLTSLSEQCNSDLDKLLLNFETLKNRLQASLEEKAVQRKQEQRLQASEIHKQKLEELAMSYEAAKAIQEKCYEELMKSVEDNKFFDISIAHTEQEYDRTFQLINTFQNNLLKLSRQMEKFAIGKQQIVEEGLQVKSMLQDILEVCQLRVHNIEATVQVIKQTINCLLQIQTLATELDKFLTSKFEECDKVFRSYWLESLIEHVNLVCEMWTFLQVRILRKKKDIQHVSLDLETIKLQLQDASERENLTDVARFQKKKKKQENVLNDILKELERLMNKQANTMLNIQLTVDHLNQLNEPSYGVKIEALTNPAPSVL